MTPIVTFLFGILLAAILPKISWSKHGNLPSIFILGAQKGGSSSLFEFLIEHPILCRGVKKELHFFDDHKKYGWQTGNMPSKSDYMKLFPGDPDCVKKDVHYRYIDATTMLHVMDTISKWMYEFYTPEERSELKFIAILRDPVARDFSWYQQVARDQLGGDPSQRSGGGEECVAFNMMNTMREADMLHARHIRRSGRYAEQLGNFTTYFRRDQLFVLSSQTLFRNTSTVMDALSQFLGVEKVKRWDEAMPHDDHLGHKSWTDIVDCMLEHIPKLDCSFRDELARYYEPYNAKLYEWLRETRAAASPYEPPFHQFGDAYKSIPCVADARAEYNALIAADPTATCRKIQREQRPRALRAVALPEEDSDKNQGGATGGLRERKRRSKKRV